ncbi:MAG: AlpA family phage regulatory protein [Parvibaculum sp.]
MELKRCVDWKVLKTVVPYSRQHIHRLETDEQHHHGDSFPRRVQLGKCRVCWWLHEVYEWLERRRPSE